MRTATAVCKACFLGNDVNPLPAGTSMATIHYDERVDASIIVPHFKTCPLLVAEQVASEGAGSTTPGSAFWLPPRKP